MSARKYTELAKQGKGDVLILKEIRVGPVNIGLRAFRYRRDVTIKSNKPSQLFLFPP